MFKKEIIVQTLAETAEAASEFANVIKKGSVITLTGNLGAGKTYFVKALCKKYNILNVSSPSFAIVNTYSGKEIVHHFDFYRIISVNELYDIGFEEYISDEEAIVFIEWAELFEEIIPKKRFQINIDFINDYKRKINIEERK
ncbi:MAG: tRNA (adenosine(37)-N6)-threonylcarbamoyltransferase complex ATPase subunit type 1 TsaE [Bacteroidota bacterium]